MLYHMKLHFRRGDLVSTGLLLALGGSALEEDASQKTPLHFALSGRHGKCVQLLSEQVAAKASSLHVRVLFDPLADEERAELAKIGKIVAAAVCRCAAATEIQLLTLLAHSFRQHQHGQTILKKFMRDNTASVANGISADMIDTANSGGAGGARDDVAPGGAVFGGGVVGGGGVTSGSPPVCEVPPLVLAASAGNLETVKVLLGLGFAEVNDCSHSGKTALFVASELGHTAIADFLLAAGASIDCLTSSGKNALHAAVEHNHKHIMSLLCKEARVHHFTQ